MLLTGAALDCKGPIVVKEISVALERSLMVPAYSAVSYRLYVARLPYVRCEVINLLLTNTLHSATLEGDPKSLLKSSRHVLLRGADDAECSRGWRHVRQAELVVVKDVEGLEAVLQSDALTEAEFFLDGGVKVSG